uniref:C2H2-type domain-containing protein n=1 Tax=Monopterus albus TaxID=43700 RepID=A0A3Q3R2R5_MONAL
MDGTINDRFESEIGAVVEVSVRATVAALARDGAGGGDWTAPAAISQIFQELGKDLTVKITELYRDTSSEVLRENRALKVEVEQLESDLKRNLVAAFELEKQLRNQVGRLRKEVAHLDQDLKNMRTAKETRELLERDRRERTVGGPVHVLLQSGSALGTPEMSLYTGQMVSDPAALSVAILSSAVATGQTPGQPLAPGLMTSQHNLTSVSRSLSVRDAAASTQPASNLTVNSLGNINLHPPLGPTGQATNSPPPSAGQEPEPVDSSAVKSEPQETVIKLSEDQHEDTAGQSAASDLGKGTSHGYRRRDEKHQEKRVCEKCNKGFRYPYQLRLHMSCHDKPFSCDQCDKCFHTEKTLQTHLQAHRAKMASQNVWACSQCDKRFSFQDRLAAHLLHHEAEKKSFACSVCEKTYNKMHLLRRHETAHSTVRPFICDTCGKGFKAKSGLRQHQSIHTGERRFTCATCGMRFRTSGHLFGHKRVHSDERPFRCFDCGKAFKLKRMLVQHQIVHTKEKPFICEMCGAGFGLKFNLQKHLRFHTGEKCFRCEKCGEEFSGTRAFKTHMFVHGTTKPFKCHLCGKTFFFNSKLLEHQRDVHGDQEAAPSQQREQPAGFKPFSCKVCQRCFSSPNTLRRHEETHSEENKFICSTCGKIFHHKYTFVYHMRSHNEESFSSCSVCGKRFLQPSRLKEHMTIHTGEKMFSCEQCGKAFRIRNNLYRHTKIHRGVRPYQCQVCGGKFSQAQSLKLHMQKHTGVKLYTCPHCSRGFCDSRNLKKHRCGDQRSTQKAAK